MRRLSPPRPALHRTGRLLRQRIGQIAHRGGEVAQLGLGLRVVGRGQKRFPGLATGFFHQSLPEADGFPQDGDGLVERAAWSSSLPKASRRQCQLKRGIELRGVAEALDEGLELSTAPCGSPWVKSVQACCRS